MPGRDSQTYGVYRAAAYAKLNLALGVGPAIDQPGAAGHGYHPICSWMHAIGLHDRIEIQVLGADRPSEHDIAWDRGGGRSERVEWALEDDLCVRAHRALERHTGRTLGVRVRVGKSIPAGGGLGGGSSDAAGVLNGLNTLFGLGLGQREVVGIAMGLGSDIAFFLDEGRSPPRPAIVEGLGEQIQRLDPAHAGEAVTLILPPVGCPTGEVYARFDGLNGGDTSHHLDPERVRGLAEAESIDPGGLFNDLAPAAEAVAPMLAEIRERVREAAGAPVHITGSGSTLFVVGSHDLDRVKAAAGGCTVLSTRLL